MKYFWALKTLMARIFIDTAPDQGIYKGWTRESLGLLSLNYTTNDYIYTEGISPVDNYWIENMLRDFNLSFIVLIVV